MQCDKSKHYTIQLVCIKQANRLLHKFIWLWNVFYFGQRCWSPPPVSQAPDPWFWKKNSRVRVSGNRRRAAITSWGYCFSIIKAEPSSSTLLKVGVWLHHVWFVSYSITGPVKSLKMLQVKYKKRRFANNCCAWDGRQNNNRMMGWKKKNEKAKSWMTTCKTCSLFFRLDFNRQMPSALQSLCE